MKYNAFNREFLFIALLFLLSVHHSHSTSFFFASSQIQVCTNINDFFPSSPSNAAFVYATFTTQTRVWINEKKGKKMYMISCKISCNLHIM